MQKISKIFEKLVKIQEKVLPHERTKKAGIHLEERGIDLIHFFHLRLATYWLAWLSLAFFQKRLKG